MIKSKLVLECRREEFDWNRKKRAEVRGSGKRNKKEGERKSSKTGCGERSRRKYKTEKKSIVRGKNRKW
jgi:hypothetical protein